MKNLKIVSIIILCGLLLFLCTILGFGLRDNRGSSSNNYGISDSFHVVLEKEVDPSNISSLQVNYGMNSNSVTFYENTDNTILIKEYMNFNPEESQISTVKQQGNELVITGKKRNSDGGFLKAYTEIYLPADFYAALSVKTISGDISSARDFLQGTAFSIATTSGDIDFPKAEAADIQISSTSGDVQIGDVMASTLRANTISGNITFDYVEGDTSVSTTSGDIILTYVKGAASASTTSGDVTLTYVEKEASASTTSGNIRIEESGENCSASSSSGDIFLSNVKGSFDLDTTSGYISVEDSQSFGNANSISGEIRIFLEELTGSLDISTTSGDVDIKLPESSAFALEFGSTSGNCSTFFDDVLSFNKKATEAKGQYGVANGNSIMVSTVSGDLRITHN